MISGYFMFAYHIAYAMFFFFQKWILHITISSTLLNSATAKFPCQQKHSEI